MVEDTVPDLVAALHREHWPRAVAALGRRFGDLDLAEEAVQEAYAAALRTWPDVGVPSNPAGWVTTVARNRAIDRLRRDRRLRERLDRLQQERRVPGESPGTGGMDDVLALLFACCHPGLDPDARVGLTLRLVAGLQTAEIARAFLVSETAMAQRLVRAKRKIRDAGIPLRMPPGHLLSERLRAVLAVLYLMGNEAHSATTAPGVVRADVGAEAIRLARLLLGMMPDESEVAGLLSLLLLTHARRDARTDGRGHMVLLPDQDRTRWDRSMIDEAVGLLEAAVRRGGAPGSYRLQAAIAAVHTQAPAADATDWRTIVALYDRLQTVMPSPVVALNRAVAVAMVDGPDAGLRIIDSLAEDGRLARYHLLPATQADLLRRLGRRADAAERYRVALALATSPADRDFLAARLTEVGGAS